MDEIHADIMEKYIIKNAKPESKKMKRNLQPEIEKLKSVQQSIRGLYINQSELNRLKSEVDLLIRVIDSFNNP